MTSEFRQLPGESRRAALLLEAGMLSSIRNRALAITAVLATALITQTAGRGQALAS